MSEYQLESNFGMASELELDSNLHSNSVYDLYGADDTEKETDTEKMNSNMSSNLDGSNNFTNLSGASGSYMSNDSIRKYHKKRVEEFDSENRKF
jgi:hypothetical protein